MEHEKTYEGLPHSISLSVSTKGVVSGEFKARYAESCEAKDTLVELYELIAKAAGMFPTFALDERMNPKE